MQYLIVREKEGRRRPQKEVGMQRKKRKSETPWTKLNLDQELSESIEAEWRSARLTFWIADGLLYASIVFSIAATLVVSSGWLPGQWAALIAAAPAMVISLERSFKLSARSDWHYKYFLRLLAIARRMRDEGMTAIEASRELTRLDIEMDQAFPQRDFSGASRHVSQPEQTAQETPSDVTP
jgi:hypothetical protein